MLKRFFQRAWSAAVTAAKFVGKCLRAVADAVGLSALPLHVIRGDASLAAACKASVSHMVSQANIVATGAVTKAAVSAVGTAATKLGMAKVAAWCACLAPVSPVAVGTAVIGAGLCVLFVGAVWLAKRAVKKAPEFIKTLSAIEDTWVTVGGLAQPA
jgi:hypothetical protein